MDKYVSPWAEMFKEDKPPKPKRKKLGRPRKHIERRRFEFRIKETETDIIAKLEEVPNASDYIRKLIKKDLRKKRSV
jgi:hypothetical protein